MAILNEMKESMQPLVSVTMSAFNVEPFLRDCLDCVINQTLREIEVICINDGSTRLSYYRQQPAATTHRTGWKRADLAVMDLVKDYLNESGLYETYQDIFIQKQLEALCGVHDVVDSSFKAKAMKLIHDRFGGDQLRYVRGSKPLRWHAQPFIFQ